MDRKQFAHFGDRQRSLFSGLIHNSNRVKLTQVGLPKPKGAGRICRLSSQRATAVSATFMQVTRREMSTCDRLTTGCPNGELVIVLGKCPLFSQGHAFLGTRHPIWPLNELNASGPAVSFFKVRMAYSERRPGSQHCNLPAGVGYKVTQVYASQEAAVILVDPYSETLMRPFTRGFPSGKSSLIVRRVGFGSTSPSASFRPIPSKAAGQPDPFFSSPISGETYKAVKGFR
jgi:hypothetical protein